MRSAIAVNYCRESGKPIFYSSTDGGALSNILVPGAPDEPANNQ
jgi:hypothetical protein